MTILLEYSIDHTNIGGSFHYYGDSDAVDRINKLKSDLKSGDKIDRVSLNGAASEEKEKIHIEMENQNQAILEKLYFDIDHNEVI